MLLAIVAFLCLTATTMAQQLTLDQLLEATCRVGVSDAYGTGTVVSHKQNLYYILTNAHVVGKNDVATVEFFTKGIKTLPIKADVVWKVYQRGTSVDFALLTIPDNAIKGWSPRVIELAPRSFSMRDGDYIKSAGCPEARWPMAWEGSALNVGSRVIFTPPPTGGQSGSGVFVQTRNASGAIETRLGAIVTWRIGDNGRSPNGYDLATGGAIPVSTLYDAIEGKVSSPGPVPNDYFLIQSPRTSDSNYLDKALGSDGKYYSVSIINGEKRAVDLPKTVSILRWPETIQARNPANPQFHAPPGLEYGYNDYGTGSTFRFGGNRRNPSPDYKAPPKDTTPLPIPDIGGILGGQDDEDSDNDNSEEIDALQATIQQLKADKKNLLDLLKNKSANIEALNAQLEEALKNGEDNKAQIESLSITIADREKEVAELTKQLKDIEINLNSTTSTSTNTTETVSYSNIQTLIGGVGGLGVLSLLGWGLYKLGVRKRIKDAMDKVEDGLQSKVTPIIGEDNASTVRGMIDALETRLGDLIEKRLSNKSSLNTTEIDNKVQDVLDSLQKIKQQAESMVVPGGQFNHPDFVAPPEQPIYQTPGQPINIKGVPGSPMERVEGLGPIVPEHPAHLYSSHEILDAIDNISRKYSSDPSLSKVNILVRQALKSPRRPSTQ